MSTKPKAPEPSRKKRVFQKTTRAADQLRADLLNGFYGPGRWFNVSGEATRLGISVVTMAETILPDVVRDGLLEKRQHHGSQQARATYYVPKSLPQPGAVPALLAEARASVALDGETQSYGAEGHTEPSAKDTNVSLAKIVAAGLRDEIAAGKYPVGTFVPTQADLAAEFGTSSNVAFRATRHLQEEGLLQRAGNPGRLRVVALPPAPKPSEGLREQNEPAEEIQAAFDAGEKGVTGTPTKRQTVTEYLKDAILSGDFPADSILPSRDVLATKLGVGSTTVDYVVGRLEVAGLVSIVPGRGAVVLPEAERKTMIGAPLRQAPPIDEDGEPEDLISASEVLPIIRVLSDENRQLRAAQETAKNAAERLSGYEEEIKRLRGQVAEERGKARRLDDENAELRGKLHRRGGNGRVIHTFGADFNNSVGWSEADATHIKSKILMAAPKGAKVQ